MTKISSKKQINEDSAAAGSLHPGSGVNGSGAINSGGGGVGDVNPSNNAKLVSKFGNSMSRDDTAKTEWFNKMLAVSKSYYGMDQGDAAGNRASIRAKASDAVGKATSEEVRKDLDALLGEEFSADFKEKAFVVFEAALGARVIAELARLEDQYEESLDEACGKIHEDVMNKVETYIEYVSEEWMDQNEVAIESALRTEITQSLINGVRQVFADHSVILPEDTSVVDELAGKVQELETRLADAIQDNAELRKYREESERADAVAEACDGLTTVEKEKFICLAEGLNTDTIEEFKEKVGVLRESVHPTKTKENKVEELLEDVSEDNADLAANPKDKYQGLTAEQKGYVSTIDRLWKN